MREQAINNLTADVYTEYHARARKELDKVHDDQLQWIESRNLRQEKAATFLKASHLVLYQ